MTFTGNDSLLYEKRDGKAYITINRPEAMNAHNADVRNGLHAALLDLRDDPAVRVGIITGAGGRAFSVGMDLKLRAKTDAEGGSRAPLGGGAVEAPAGGGNWDQMGVWKPMIAAIDGYCVAGGFEVALQCDIRIATQQSRFGLPEPRRALLGGQGVHNLPTMIPLGCAMYILLTGGHIDAERAAQWGLIQDLLPDREALMRRADEIAEEIMLCAPLSVQFIKRLARQGRRLPEEISRKMEQPFREVIEHAEDRLEGPRAFAEKRKPVWKGR